MNEQLKILEMIEKGVITASEGMELLEALKSTKDPDPIQQMNVTTYNAIKRSYKYLKIRVTSDNKSVNVNVNIPIRLLSAIGQMTGKMTNMIPRDARKEMENKGIDITSMDFARIIDELLNGTLDDPNIVDVETWDEEHKAMVKVKIFVD